MRLAAICTLALITGLATTSEGAVDYNSWIKAGEVHVRFYDTAKVAGPFKFYIARTGTPQASTACHTCPNGVEPEFIIPSALIYQRWAPNNRYVDAIFAHSSVDELESFFFTAVTHVPDQEKFLASGIVPKPIRTPRS